MKKYEKYFNKYKEQCVDNDNINGHETQDKICKKFILDIARNKLSVDEIKLIALKIEKITFNGPKLELWYA